MPRVVFLFNIINIKRYVAVPMSSTTVASDGNITWYMLCTSYTKDMINALVYGCKTNQNMILPWYFFFSFIFFSFVLF